MRITKIILRVIIGLLFLAIGLYHFYAYEFLAVFVPLPHGSKIFVCVIAALISLSSIGIMMNKFTRASLITLALIFLVTAFMTAIPMTFREPDEIIKRIGFANLIKFGLASILLVFLVFSKQKH
jgi:uncharacterized membrane protein